MTSLFGKVGWGSSCRRLQFGSGRDRCPAHHCHESFGVLDVEDPVLADE
jgi:hypothetical protein